MRVRGDRQEGLPSHPPKRTNGADRRSGHSSNTKYNNRRGGDFLFFWFSLVLFLVK